MKRNKVQSLPKAVRDWLDAALIDGNFSGYAALVDELRERGYEISKSGLHRYGSTLEQRIATVRDTALAMQMMDRATDGDGDSKSAGLMALIQTEIFNALLALKGLEEEEKPDPMKRAAILSMIAKNAAASVRGSIEVKKHQQAAASEEAAAAPTAPPVVEVRFVAPTPENAPGAPKRGEGA